MKIDWKKKRIDRYRVLDYEVHRALHQAGRNRKNPGRSLDRYGDRSMFCAITPYGLSTEWEAPYMKRIRDGETGARFEREIKNSPLTKPVIDNLIMNLKRVRRARWKRSRQRVKR